MTLAPIMNAIVDSPPNAGHVPFEVPPKPEVPVLACGHLDLVLVPPKTKRGKAKWVRRWRMWNDNGEMIADVCRLFVDLKNDRVLDPTYGAGNFWTDARPRKLVTRDIRIDGFDARTMRTPDAKRPAYKPESFQVVVLDFPYVSKGGRDTSTIPDMDEAYGMYDAPRTPQEVQQLISEGMSAALPLLVEDGYLMVKTMNYISSAKVYDSVFHTKMHAINEIGVDCLVGEFVFSSGNPGPQPLTNLNGSKRVQEHGRNNWSTLLVFQKRKPKRTRKAQVTAALTEMSEQVIENAKGLVQESKRKVTGSNVRANLVLGDKPRVKAALAAANSRTSGGATTKTKTKRTAPPPPAKKTKIKGAKPDFSSF